MRWLTLSLANLFIERACFRLRIQIQLFTEDLLARLILFQCRAVLSRLQIDFHQLAVRGFIQGIEADRSSRMRDRFVRLTQLAVRICKHTQGICKLAPQVFRFRKRPFVEIRRVLEAEPGQEVVAIKFNGIQQSGNAERCIRLLAALGN